MADKTTLPNGASKELGRSGTTIFAGIISSEEYNRQLVGVAGNQKYEIMRRSDSTVRSALQIVKLPILSTTFDVEPIKDEEGNATPEDIEKAAFIKRELMERNIDFHKFLKQALTQFDFGFSVFEKVYELTEYNGKPRIGIQKLASRKQVTIQSWETEDKKDGIQQLCSDGSFASIPREKLLIFTHDQEGDNYEGISLLRYVYKEWDIKDKLMIVNAIALEKLGVGVPVVRARDGMDMTVQDEQDAIDALSNMRANEKAYLKAPKTVDVEFLDLKGNTTKDIIPTLVYLDGRIMTAILARFTELGGASGSGAESLSRDLSSLFMKAEEAVVKDIIASITNDLIKQLCEFNFSDNASGYPKLTFGSVGDDDTSELATNVASLVTAGAMTAEASLENHLRSQLRIPELPKEIADNYETIQRERKGTGGTPTDTAVDKKETDKLDKEKDVKASLKRARAAKSELASRLVGANPGA